MTKTSIKLSDWHRREILKRLLAGKFEKAKLAVEEEMTALGELIFHHVYDTATQKKMNALPDGWLPAVKTFKARLSGTETQFILRKPRRIPHEKFSYRDEAGFIYAALPSGCP